MLKIISAPNDILNQPVKPVKKIDLQIKKLVLEMEKTLIAQTNPPGVGLAAPQIGEKLALFIAKPTKKAKTEVFINPRILKCEVGNRKKSHLTRQNPASHLSYHTSKHKPLKLEGCLSIPRIWGPVKRAKKVFLQYQDINGITRQQWFDGFIATIIQHEMDHLNGILFTQRTIEQKMPLYEEKGGELVKLEY